MNFLKGKMDTSSGKEVATATPSKQAGGQFLRKDSKFRDTVTQGGQFPPEADRYHLYVSYACPWACRALTMMHLKGLDHAITVSVVHPVWGATKPNKDEHKGWVFADPTDAPIANPNGFGSFAPIDVIPDPINHASTVRDIYELCGDTTGPYTVPILFDKIQKKIVNNESSEIIRIFNSQFNTIAKSPQLDYYPEKLRSKIDEVNAWVYPCINNGVYRCGFAKSQEAYEAAFHELFDALDKTEGMLASSRYLCGSEITEADIRLFQTLIRFDPVYVVYFKTNKKFINQYPSIKAYVQDLYQNDSFKKAVNMYHIKTHYFSSHGHLNYFAIVPVGPDPWWEEAPPANRKLGRK